MKKYKYIFWDMDGTVANTYEGVSNCLAYALEPYGIHLEGEQEIRKFIGPPFRLSFKKYLGFDERKAEEAIARYRERYIPVGVYECELFDGVRETIQAFKEAGYVQVITSSKPEAQCRQILEKFDLTSELDEVVGASADGKIDTKIQVLQEAFSRMEAQCPDFSKENAVLIGDTHYDADGAKEGGIDCVGVGYGFGGAEEMWNAGAMAVYEDQKALREAVL